MKVGQKGVRFLGFLGPKWPKKVIWDGPEGSQPMFEAKKVEIITFWETLEPKFDMKLTRKVKVGQKQVRFLGFLGPKWPKMTPKSDLGWTWGVLTYIRTRILTFSDIDSLLNWILNSEILLLMELFNFVTIEIIPVGIMKRQTTKWCTQAQITAEKKLLARPFNDTYI